MSIVDIKPDEVPVELRVRIEKVMARQKLNWHDAILFLARKVVSPR